jgi:hypothetical protein
MRIPIRWSLAPLLLVALPFQASAQHVATTFEQLAVLVEPGDTITVVDPAGVETTGKLRKLSAQGLTLDGQDQPREWAASEVTRILQRRQDSLANGALIGLVSGAAAFAVLYALTCSIEDCEGEPNVLIGAAAYGGMGAGVGVGIDALITRRRAIYERSSPAAAIRFNPILSKGRRGLAVSIAY